MSDALSDAQTRYREALDALSDQRRQIDEDLAFSDPSDPEQWDPIEKVQRERDPGGARPCLVHDQTGQYVATVAGQVEQRPPALHAIPVGDGADKKVAEQLDGFFRHIEHASRAQQHYARALTSAGRAGVGYLIVRPEFTDRALGYQEPRIGSEGDPLRCVIDPWSVELDGSDADWGVHLTPMSHAQFERQYGSKKAKVSFGDREGRTCDTRESVITAEQWQVENNTRNMVFCIDLTQQTGEVFALPEDQFWERQKLGQVQAQPDSAGRQTYKDKYRCVKWSVMSGADVLVDETEYPASGIGIVPVYGYVGWADGRMKYCGIPRRAREPQRAYNFHLSEMRALMATAPRSPWTVPVRAIAGLESLWDRASVEQRAYLPYHDCDPSGDPIAAPNRTPVAINLANHMQGAEQAIHDIQASLGMYQASLGAPSNETSGVAIEGRKQQGEAATSHFPSHLAASLGQVGKLVMEMVPKLIDTKRQLRILGIDQSPGKVTIDPKQPQAMVETPQGLSINPNVGRYDVRVVVGASFSTQRQQAQEAYTEMMRANPQMMPAIAPLWAQTLDVPHADKLAQVLTAVAPDAVKAVLNPESDKAPTTAELMQQIDQLKQGLQEAIEHAHQAQQDADENHAKANDKDEENEIRRYEAETNRLKVTGANDEQIKAIVAELVNEMLTSPEPVGDERAEPAEPMTPEPQEAPPEEMAPAGAEEMQ